MISTKGRIAAATAAVAWALGSAAACAKGATETSPLTNSATVGAGGSTASAGGSGEGGSTASGGKTPCTKGSDCPSGICQSGFCAAADCTDKKQDGNETDVDCGGDECGPCATGKNCEVDSDCKTSICSDAGKCADFDCGNQKLDGTESDVDCGGSSCPACGPGQKCSSNADCGGAPCVLLNGSMKCKFEATFTTCGQTGATGPTQAQCDAAYAGGALKSKVTVTNGYQLFTVPGDGVYQIEAFGAQGGKHVFGIGGSGARMRGDFTLKKGDVLKIVVGQKGSDGDQFKVGGGGGTFVARFNNNVNEALIVAGGGGGAGNCGGYDLAAMHGKAASGNGSGGTSNNNGYYCGCGGEGSGGGGFTGNGGGGGGLAFINGATGCTTKRPNQCSDPGIGGFGGGGNGGNGGGGGGGYQGGNAGGDAGASGRGGLSFNSGANTNNADGANADHGKVTIKSL